MIDYNSIEHDLYNELHKGVVTVIFNKVDGSERVMKCTLSLGMIPEDMKPKGDDTRVLSEEVVRVYDVEAEGWRSFRKDSIISVNYPNCD